jgi:hypothetical protein
LDSGSGFDANSALLPLKIPVKDGDISGRNETGRPIIIQEYNHTQIFGGLNVANESNQKSSIIYGNVTNSAVNVDNMIASLNNAINGNADPQIRALEGAVSELGAAFAADRAVDQAWKESVLESLEKLAKSSDAGEKRSRASIVSTLLKAAPAAISGVVAIAKVIKNLIPMIDQMGNGG